MDQCHIAAQLYTLRDFIKTPEDIRKTLRKVREIGYESVQVSGMGPVDPIVLKEMMEELGLSICVTHTPPYRLKNDLGNVIKEHRLWNCSYIGLGSMPNEYRTSGEGFRAFIKEYSEIGKKIADAGLHFVYHNHRFEFEKFNGITGMDMLLNETDPDIIGFIIDTYWVQAGGADPVEWVKKVKGRMNIVHFKDMAIKSNQQVYAEIGEGNLNWANIIEACRETGVIWYAVEQDDCLRDPFESLAMSFKYLQGFIR